eukprot:TRINITY_DN75366_c0_g1_i1.p1 TRINITY_DN75366_c0_g1~~TRINITY_DN75366_c0_g1_i1.p1  ORF type:complete len:520 (-),score=99.67 TRINITY_DN75366_c0_g1_i1:56-1615(-)
MVSPRYWWTVRAAAPWTLAVIASATWAPTASSPPVDAGAVEATQIVAAVGADFREGAKTTAKSKRRRLLPVVYNWYGPKSLPAYFILTLNVTSRRNDVIVLSDLPQSALPAPGALGPRVSFIDMTAFMESSKDFFAGKGSLANGGTFYRPWGFKEPWQGNNVRRWFIIHEWLKARPDLDNIFYADCDVVLLTDVDNEFRGHSGWAASPPRGLQTSRSPPSSPPPSPPTSRSKQQPSPSSSPAPPCDAFLRLPWQTHKSLMWMAVAHSSVLNRRLLEDFVAFVKEMYSPAYLPILAAKRKHAPYVCDMTQWYFFAAATGHWSDTPQGLKLPRVPNSWRLCNITETRDGAHFDASHGFELPGFALQKDGHASYGGRDPLSRTRLLSLHFQGRTKLVMAKVVGSIFGDNVQGRSTIVGNGRGALAGQQVKQFEFVNAHASRPLRLSLLSADPRTDEEVAVGTVAPRSKLVVKQQISAARVFVVRGSSRAGGHLLDYAVSTNPARQRFLFGVDQDAVAKQDEL